MRVSKSDGPQESSSMSSARDARDARDADAAIVERLRLGDAEALTVIMRRYQPGLFTYLVRWTGVEPLAADVVQDVFFRLWRTRDALRLPHGLRVHLYAAARRRALDYLRSERRTAVRDGTFTLGHAAVVDPEETFPDVDRAALERAVREAVASLPPRAREVWRLCREQELSYADAAAVLGVSVGTIKTQMSRALGVVRAAAAALLSWLVVVRL